MTTTKRLTKGMYGHEFGPRSKDVLFGLHAGQMAGREKVTHNSGWYNREGEKLGWGDLSVTDIYRITLELKEDELFIVLCESDSFWNFVTKPGLIGSMAQVKPDVNAPGQDYVAKKCQFIIAKDQVYLVRNYGLDKDEVEIHGGVRAKLLSRDAAKKLIIGN